MKQSTDDIRESKTTDIDDLDTAIISFAGAVRKETLALGVNDPSYEVQPLFSPFKAKLQTLIDQEVKKAVISELDKISIKVIEPCEPDCTPERHARHKGSWNAHLVIEERIAELEKDKK